MQSNARETALMSLKAFRRDNAWSDGFLKHEIRRAGLDTRDAALASRICYGVLQNLYLLDFYISRFSTLPNSRIEPLVLDILRIGAYQIFFLDKVPSSAAINECVELSKRHAKRSSGFVNAVLRAMSRADSPPEPEDWDITKLMSVRYSHPLWFVESMIKKLGLHGAEELLIANNAAPPICAQVNTLKTSRDALLERLKEEGLRAEGHIFLDNCVVFTGSGDLERLPSFQEGLFFVQDAASRIAVNCIPRLGELVLDVCAAPGGKSFSCAMRLCGEGRIMAMDIHEHKLGLIEAGASRLGIDSIKTVHADARVNISEIAGLADAVICDVPCSGFGVIRKKPDMRYKLKETISKLPGVQYDILINSSKYVKIGGYLMYTTCTVFEEENEEVVGRFLENNSSFAAVPFNVPDIGEAAEGHITLWPHIHNTDGFFICLMKRLT